MDRHLRALVSIEDEPSEPCEGRLWWVDHHDQDWVIFELDDGAEIAACERLAQGVCRVKETFKKLIIPSSKVSVNFIFPSSLGFEMAFFL